METSRKNHARQKADFVQQTLNTCLRCSQPLCGPKCSRCGFDHTAEPVCLLCLMPPKKLQIQTSPGEQEIAPQEEPAAPKKSRKNGAQPKANFVQQTLNTCLRCSQPLCGPKCSRCGFDHTAEPVYLLCLMSPKKLQIQTSPGEQAEAHKD